MPRNGSDIYFIPPGTEGFPDTTIESAKYNTYVHDVETDLNTPRPIVAGGTGADDADEALANLGAEKSSAQVTNYDSHVWLPGSFYSATTATGSPVAGHAFVGFVVSSDPPQSPPLNQNVVVHARDQNDTIVPGRPYVREKKAGTWGPWKPEGMTLYTSDTPPVGAPDNSLWWESDSGLLYLRYNDGAGVPQWVIACPQPDISAFIRSDVAQSIAAPQQQQARQNIYAAPFDAMMFNGLQVNGAMGISQENGLTAVTIPTGGGAKYVVDGWYGFKQHGSTVTAKQNTGVVLGNGYYRAVMSSVATTAFTSVAAGEYTGFGHRIEGFRVAKMGWGLTGAQPITVSFWIMSSVPGHASLAVTNNTAVRSYTVDVTINAGDVWEYKSVTIPGDTTDTWAKDNAVGIQLSWTFVCGATFQTAAGVWTAGNFIATPAQTNLFSLLNNQVSITGVTVYAGGEGPTSDRAPLLTRPADRELVTCQRYWQKIEVGATNLMAVGTTIGASVQLPIAATMRVTPTVTLPWTNANYANPNTATTWTLTTPGVSGVNKTGTASTVIYATQSSAMAAVYGATFSGTATAITSGANVAPITIDARL